MARRARRRRPQQIEKPVKVCGSRRCVRARGIVDTGASITAITKSLADRIGAGRVGPKRRLGNVGGTVEVEPVAIQLCVKATGCGCISGIAAAVRTEGFGSRANVLIGQDYLSTARAKIDSATGSIRCQMRKAKRRRR